jgi:NAD-dependent SIR2 family protein deacetylase
MDAVTEGQLDHAARAIAGARALVIGAGAGMGVDSGLPDFRGTQGFWRAYPPYEKLRLDFVTLANPRWFHSDPTLAWGFYGHRLNLYRSAQPHAGFAILSRWAERLQHGAAVFTSNVDGHFQRAGFERVYEVHGAIDWMQCTSPCGVGIFRAGSAVLTIDEETMRVQQPLPACPQCGALARPNVLMFNDWQWDSQRSDEQGERLNDWLATVANEPIVIVECGAGTAIPTVRRFCERLGEAAGATLIRINVREPEVPAGQIGIALGALEALQAIDARLSESLSRKDQTKRRS